MLNNALKKLLENEIVRNYFEALKAMQSPEVIALFRELPPSIKLSGPIDYISDFIQENSDELSDDELERICEFAITLQDKRPARLYNPIDFRKFEYDFVANNDLFAFLYDLNTIDNMLSSGQFNPDEYETAKMGDRTIRPAVTKEAVVNAVAQAVESANAAMECLDFDDSDQKEEKSDKSDKKSDKKSSKKSDKSSKKSS